MSVRRIAVLVAVSSALALAGCAGNTVGSGSEAPASGPVVSGAPASDLPASGAPAFGAATSMSSATPTVAAVPPSRKLGPGKPTAETLSGTVVAGVEPGCLILQGAGSHHVLIFSDPALRSTAQVGSSITVTGRAEPSQMTTCQQGVAFIVTAVRAN